MKNTGQQTSARDKFRAQFANLSAGLISGSIFGLFSVAFSVALATIVLPGTLKTYLPAGIGVFLLGNAVASIVVSLLSTYRYRIASVQSDAIVMITMVTGAIAAAATPGGNPLPTVVAAIGLCTLLTGVTFFVLGWLRLGRIVRFFPYPVLSGFMAGIGFIMSRFALSSTMGTTAVVWTSALLLDPAIRLMWMPSVLLGIFLVVVSKRFSHYLVVPVTLVSAIGLFFIGLSLSGISIADAISRHWFLGPFPQGQVWPPISLADISDINWQILADHWGTFLTAAASSVLMLLMKTSTLELTTHQEIDLNKELRVSGIANVLAGLMGGSSGYTGTGGSFLSYKLQATGRTPGFTLALFSLAAMILGTRLLTIFPAFVIGGLTFYIGLMMLVPPLLGGWRLLPRFEYLLVICVFLAVVVFGFTFGFLFGMTASLSLFVINYSRSDVVRRSTTGVESRSTASRSLAIDRLLTIWGREIRLLKLQGYIFFGSAHDLLLKCQTLISPSSEARYVILDFETVSGIDGSGLTSFVRLRTLAREANVTLVFCGLLPNLRRHLEQISAIPCEADIVPDGLIQVLTNSDHALEWCEERLLNLDEYDGHDIGELAYWAVEERAFFQDLLTAMEPYLERTEVSSNQVLWRQNDPSEDMYFVESGKLELTVIYEGLPPQRLATLGKRSMVGMNELYLGVTRQGTMQTLQPCVLHRLRAGTIQVMTAENPALMSRLHHHVATTQTQRLASSFNSFLR